MDRQAMPGAMPDGTAAANDVGPMGDMDFTAADLKRGYKLEHVERTPLFSADDDGGATSVGDPFTFGGVLGRPQGTAR